MVRSPLACGCGEDLRPIVHFVLWQFGLVRAETQTTARERDCLARHAAGRKQLVEVGTWHGVTTLRLREAMAASAVLYGVDPYPRGRLGISLQRRIATRELAKTRNGVMKWVRMTGAEAARRHVAAGLPSVDFIFIDGDHTYEGLRADWEGWSPLVASGGIVGLHDSRSTPERPIEDAGSVIYTREAISRDSRFELVETVDSLTILRRRSST